MEKTFQLSQMFDFWLLSDGDRNFKGVYLRDRTAALGKSTHSGLRRLLLLEMVISVTQWLHRRLDGYTAGSMVTR